MVDYAREIIDNIVDKNFADAGSDIKDALASKVYDSLEVDKMVMGGAEFEDVEEYEDV